MKTSHRIAAFATVAILVALVPSAATAQWECPEASATAASCGQSICPEDGIQTADALNALKAAVGAAYCASCRCDVDANGSVTASDAIRILRTAVGTSDTLTCTACNTLTLHLIDGQAASESTAAATDSLQVSGSALPSQWFAYVSAQLPDGRTAQLGRQTFNPLVTRLLLLDENGEVLSNEVFSSSVAGFGRLDCAAGINRCVTTLKYFGGYGEDRLVVTVFDVDSVANRGTTFIKDVVEEGEGDIEISTGAGSNNFICNEGGLCVWAWVLSRTTVIDQDAEDSEALGYYAAAFHAHTGEVGPELYLADSDSNDFRSPAVTRLGEDSFRVTLPTGEVFDLEVR
jgi:hypothetical protein